MIAVWDAVTVGPVALPVDDGGEIVITATGSVAAPPLAWLLSGGLWNDAAAWEDAALWEDS
jgi:hypothetical protein